jgi:hypothetical protein
MQLSRPSGRELPTLITVGRNDRVARWRCRRPSPRLSRTPSW